MRCDYCGKDDFAHISQLNRHKPQCPSRPTDKAPETTPPPSEGNYIAFTDAQVHALQERLGDDWAAVVKERTDALIKEMTGEVKSEAIIPRDFMLRHLPMVIPILPRKCILAWDIHGELDDELNLHVESIKDHRRGR